MNATMVTQDGGHGLPTVATAAGVAAVAVGTHISNTTHWSTEETKLLIKTWGDHRDEFAEIKRNLSVWNKVLEKLLNAGFFRTVEQCRNRWKFLESKYKTAAQEIHSAGRTTWEFFGDMDVAKNGSARRRNSSSSSSASAYKRQYDSPSSSPHRQASAQPLAPQPQPLPPSSLAEPQSRVLLPPIRAPSAVMPAQSAGGPRPNPNDSHFPPTQRYYHHHSPPPPPEENCSPPYMQTSRRPAYFQSAPHSNSYEAMAPSNSPQHQHSQNHARMHRRPSAGRTPIVFYQQHQLGYSPHPAPQSLTQQPHHPLAVGHLPEPRMSLSRSASPSSHHANAGTSTRYPGHSQTAHLPPARHAWQQQSSAAAHPHPSSQAGPGKAEHHARLTREDSATRSLKGAAPTLQKPSAKPTPTSTLAQPSANKVSALRHQNFHHQRALSADSSAGVSQSPPLPAGASFSSSRYSSNQPIVSQPSRSPPASLTARDAPAANSLKETVAGVDVGLSGGTAAMSNLALSIYSASRKRRRHCLSVEDLAKVVDPGDHLADNVKNSRNDSASDEGERIELVGTVSRTDLLEFLREQSRLREQRESMRAKERERMGTIQREEEWRFHEFQMSLMQLVQHSLSPFVADENDRRAQSAQGIADETDEEMAVDGRSPSCNSAVLTDAESLTGAAVPEHGLSTQVDQADAGENEASEDVDVKIRTPSPAASSLADSPAASTSLSQANPADE